MEELYQKFKKALEREDRKACLELVTRALDEGTGIVEIYTMVLAPALNNMEFSEKEGDVIVWKEHVRSAIVRNVIECCYPYVLKQQKFKAKGTAVVLCPTEEYHEIGARMVADFFTLLGYDTTFVGANTPMDNILAGIRVVRPDYVAFSVSNFYNLVAARRVAEHLLDIRKDNDLKFKLVVGGRAFVKNPGAAKDMGAHKLVNSWEELKKYLGGGK